MIYNRNLRGHAAQSNKILLKWINGDIVKADEINPDFPYAV